jgi:hypothetical protein
LSIIADTEPDWRALLIETARATFNRGGRGLLLSRVPDLLRDAGIDLEILLSGQKLASFLATNGPPAMQIVRNNENLAQWAILPPEIQIAPPMSQYFPPARTDVSRKHLPKFHPSIWRAFVTELPLSYRRWIDTSGSLRFTDLPETEEITSLVEVDREFVRTDSLFRSNDLVASHIESWAARHDIPLSKLTLFDGKKDPTGRLAENALAIFLEALTPQEASRISIPADIVARFLTGLRER